MRGCDTLVVVGSSFPYSEFLPKPGQAKCVQIDVDVARIGLRYPVEVGLIGDCQRVLDALLPMVERKKARGFLESSQKGMKEWNELLQMRASVMEKPLKPQVVAQAINKYLADDAVVASDCGTVRLMRRFLLPSPLGGEGLGVRGRRFGKHRPSPPAPLLRGERGAR